MKNRIANAQFEDHKGDLLIASTRLAQTPFAKTVVYVLQDDQNGSFGVFLNRPADANLRDAWAKASGIDSVATDHLLSGGPLGGPVFAIHPFEKLGELTVDRGIFLSATAETIDRLVTGHDEPYRIFLGVVGWQVGQLNLELEQHLWYRLPSRQDLVFDNSGMLWEKALLDFGGKKWLELLSLDKLPPNPERN